MADKQIIGQFQALPAATTGAPTGAVGLDMTLFQEASRPARWLLTVTVTVAPSDVTIWGARPAGAADVATDDVWAPFQDEYKAAPLGKIGTALPIGVYHFLICGLGVFSRVALQNSAGTVNAVLSEVLSAGRGN